MSCLQSESPDCALKTSAVHEHEVVPSTTDHLELQIVTIWNCHEFTVGFILISYQGMMILKI